MKSLMILLALALATLALVSALLRGRDAEPREVLYLCMLVAVSWMFGGVLWEVLP